MKMHRGVSDEGLARIAKTVKAQEEPPPEDEGGAEHDMDFDQFLDSLIAKGMSDEEIAEEVSMMDNGVEFLVALYRVRKEKEGGPF